MCLAQTLPTKVQLLLDEVRAEGSACLLSLVNVEDGHEHNACDVNELLHELRA
jgi:hypothetical protein